MDRLVINYDLVEGILARRRNGYEYLGIYCSASYHISIQQWKPDSEVQLVRTSIMRVVISSSPD